MDFWWMRKGVSVEEVLVRAANEPGSADFAGSFQMTDIHHGTILCLDVQCNPVKALLIKWSF